MRTITETNTTPRRLMMIALAVGVVAAVLGVIGLLTSGAALFFQAYLYSYMFWLGISLGSLALLLLHFVAGSRWGLAIRRVVEAATASIWVMAILFIPILLGMRYLFPWTDPARQHEHLIEAKLWYLNEPFFILRAVIYFAAWIAIAFLVNRHAARLSASPAGSLPYPGRGQGWSAFGLIVFAVTMTFAAVDWLMTIQPEWNSSAFGLIIIVGQVLTALAFAVVIINLLPSESRGRRWTYLQTPIPFSDLGALMLTFVMGWAYVSYFQFLIQWAGNIPREVFWYIDRSTGGWQILAIIIVVFEFALPFLILLSIRVRHNLRLLAGLGIVLLVVYLINMFWHVKPAYSPGVFSLSWLDLVMPLAVGGIWLAAFLFNLARRPALNPVDQAAIEPVRAVEEAV